MLLPDLTFNLPLAMIDLLAVAFCLVQRRRGRPLTGFFTVLLVFLPVALLLAAVVNRFYGFRIFGFFRFAGHAAAIHLPLVLLTITFLYREQRRLIWLGGGLAFVLLGGGTYAYHIEPYRLEVTEFAVTSPRLAGLERPVRILQVADFQAEAIGSYEQAVVAEMKRLEPDLILYLGDYIQIFDPERRAETAAKFNRLLVRSGLNPPLGSYALQGDCERWAGWEAMFDGTGVETLGNEARAIQLPGAKVKLVALDIEASRTESPEVLRAVAGRAPATAFEMFAGHSPDFSDQLAAQDQPFLALAGHTHGGQVRIPFYGAPITYSRLHRRRVDAFDRFGPGVLSVSRGIGMERHEAPRVRFLCRPELRLVTLLPPGEEAEGAGAAPRPIQIPDPDFQVASP